MTPHHTPLHTLHLSAPGGTQAQVACAQGARVLDALLDAGWQVPHSCRRGVCQSCRARLVTGTLQAPRLAGGDVLLCQATVMGDARLALDRLEVAPPPQRLASQARIRRLRRVAADVVHVELRLPNGVHAHWQAGQSLELRAPDGTARSYSLARPPLGDLSLHLHIRLLPGGRFSQWLEQALAEPQPPTTTLSVRLPFGSLGLPPDGRRSAILLASGTGFSALGAIAEAAIQRRDPRPLHLYWGVRRAADLYDLARAEAFARDHPALRFIPVVSESAPGQAWTGRSGLVHQAVMHDFADLTDVEVLACGAPAMLEAAQQAFRAERGLPASQWRSDAFHPAPLGASRPT